MEFPRAIKLMNCLDLPLAGLEQAMAIFLAAEAAKILGSEKMAESVRLQENTERVEEMLSSLQASAQAAIACF